VRLNAVSKQFQLLTTRSVKKEDLTVQAHWRSNSL